MLRFPPIPPNLPADLQRWCLDMQRAVTEAVRGVEPVVASIQTVPLPQAPVEPYIFGSDVTVDDSTKGLVLKSPNGHYWRFTVDNTGTLSAGFDFGSVPPDF